MSSNRQRFFSLLAAGLCAPLVAFAQTAFQREWAAGGSFGMEFSSVSFSPRVLTSLKSGITAGATLRWITEPHLGLQLEANFSERGWQERFDQAPEYQYSHTIRYVEIPFLTHIYCGSQRFRGFFNMGPQIGFALEESTDSNLNGTNPSPNRPDTQHELPIQKKFDWGLCGGPGIELRTAIGYFLLEGRFNLSLGNIYNSHKGDTFSKSANQVITAKLTYLFPFHCP